MEKHQKNLHLKEEKQEEYDQSEQSEQSDLLDLENLTSNNITKNLKSHEGKKLFVILEHA